VSPPAVRVKICGLTTVDEAVACAELGADWIGLNFHPRSPRYIPPDVAAEIVAALPRSTAAVGVFVDRPAIEVAELADRLGLRIVQLHGREPPEDLPLVDRFQIVRAFRLGGPAAWEGVMDYLVRAEALGRRPDAVLIDAYLPGQPGGTGAAIAEDLLDHRPTCPLPRLILAGGLTPRNVAERIARVRPWMVDVASGVESAPGRKDRTAVAAFIRAARAALAPGHPGVIPRS
jgi:phosphoribosylanthranilate isomerase